MSIPVEPGFRDGRPVFWWRVSWDEECFVHVEAADADEATEVGMVKMKAKRPPESVALVKEWVVVGKPGV